MHWVRVSPKPGRNLGPRIHPYLNTGESSEGGGKVGCENRKKTALIFLTQPLEIRKIIILM